MCKTVDLLIFWIYTTTLDKLFEKQTENYEIVDTLKGIPPIEKNCVKYDELVFVTLIDIFTRRSTKKSVILYI